MDPAGPVRHDGKHIGVAIEHAVAPHTPSAMGLTERSTESAGDAVRTHHRHSGRSGPSRTDSRSAANHSHQFRIRNHPRTRRTKDLQLAGPALRAEANPGLVTCMVQDIFDRPHRDIVDGNLCLQLFRGGLTRALPESRFPMLQKKKQHRASLSPRSDCACTEVNTAHPVR